MPILTVEADRTGTRGSPLNRATAASDVSPARASSCTQISRSPRPRHATTLNSRVRNARNLRLGPAGQFRIVILDDRSFEFLQPSRRPLRVLPDPPRRTARGSLRWPGSSMGDRHPRRLVEDRHRQRLGSPGEGEGEIHWCKPSARSSRDCGNSKSGVGLAGSERREGAGAPRLAVFSASAGGGDVPSSSAKAASRCARARPSSASMAAILAVRARFLTTIFKARAGTPAVFWASLITALISRGLPGGPRELLLQVFDAVDERTGRCRIIAVDQCPPRLDRATEPDLVARSEARGRVIVSMSPVWIESPDGGC